MSSSAWYHGVSLVVDLRFLSIYFFAVDFMGGDAKCVQHKIVLPMYVSYTSIPSSTANTTMKSTKLLTKPYLDVTTTTTTSDAKCNLNNSINNCIHSNINCNNNTANSMHMSKGTKTTLNNKLNISETDNSDTGKHAIDYYAMSYKQQYHGECDTNDLNEANLMKSAAHPMRNASAITSSPLTGVHKSKNGLVYRQHSGAGNGKLSGIGNNAYRSRSIRHSDSDETRSSSIDYNFNYAKFRSPLNSSNLLLQSQKQQPILPSSGGKRGKIPTKYNQCIDSCNNTHHHHSQAHDCSTTSTLATEFDSFVRSKVHHQHHTNDDQHHQPIQYPKVHNHPSCRCAIQNCCPFADHIAGAAVATATGPLYSVVALHDKKYASPRRREHSYIYKAPPTDDSPPHYDQIDGYSMKRTLSHDRLYSHRRISAVRNRTRPKSYCSNVNNYPAQLWKHFAIWSGFIVLMSVRLVNKIMDNNDKLCSPHLFFSRVCVCLCHFVFRYNSAELNLTLTIFCVSFLFLSGFECGQKHWFCWF